MGLLDIDEFLHWVFSGNKRANHALEHLGVRKAGNSSSLSNQELQPLARSGAPGRPASCPKPKQALKVAPFVPCEADHRAMQKVSRIFHQADKDRDGSLQACELEDVMQRVGLPRRDAKRLLSAADLNGDSMLDIDEFLYWVFSGNKNAIRVLEQLGERKVGSYGSVTLRASSIPTEGREDAVR